MSHIYDNLNTECIVWHGLKSLGGGQVGGRPGEKGAGGVREAGEEGKREKLCNLAQYFTIEKTERGGSQKIQGGNRD